MYFLLHLFDISRPEIDYLNIYLGQFSLILRESNTNACSGCQRLDTLDSLGEPHL